uniref:BTB domain-containing protein n=1 Tax=Panagrellus redivivus TaxID=6233 RepID=A0A7E4ZRG4_PANRE
MQTVKVVKDSTTLTLNEADLTGKKIGDGLRTTILNIPGTDGGKWWIEYFPAGYRSLAKAHVSAYNCSNMPAKAKFAFGVDGSSINKTSTYEYSDTRRGVGWSQFASHEELRPLFRDGKLTITCNVEFFFEAPFTYSPPRLFRCCEHVPTDFELVMGTDRLQVHRNLLSLMSPVFHAILSHDTSESPSGEIEITDFDFNTVKAAVDYCYGRDIENSVDLYIQILRFALKYGIKDIASQLESIPLCNLSPETFCSIALYAYDFSKNELLTKCSAFFKINHDKIKGVKKFAELPPEFVVHLLRNAFNLKTDFDVLRYACKNGIDFIVDHMERPYIEKLTSNNLCSAVNYAWECSRGELKKTCAVFVNNNHDKVMTLKLDDQLSNDHFCGLLNLAYGLKDSAPSM